MYIYVSNEFDEATDDQFSASLILQWSWNLTEDFKNQYTFVIGTLPSHSVKVMRIKIPTVCIWAFLDFYKKFLLLPILKFWIHRS